MFRLLDKMRSMFQFPTLPLFALIDRRSVLWSSDISGSRNRVQVFADIKQRHDASVSVTFANRKMDISSRSWIYLNVTLSKNRYSFFHV